MAVEKTVLDEWKELIDKFNSNVDKYLTEIRKYKQDMEQMKVEMLNEINNGQFISDDKCIVISAPRIIIGNVNKDGTLKGATGEVIIRGHKLEMDGVGVSGSIEMRAPVIAQRAMDTGIDGKEKVVYNTSKIISQATSIIIDSQSPVVDKDKSGTFLLPQSASGITLSSERGIAVTAAPANKKKKEAAKQKQQSLTTAIGKIKKKISDLQPKLEYALRVINDKLGNEDGLNNDSDLTKTNILAIDELARAIKEQMPIVNRMLLEYADSVSELAELTRQKQVMEKEMSEADRKASEYKDKSTKASIMVQSEKIGLYSKDGDGTWRTNEGAGVDIRANNIQLRSTTENGSHEEILTPETAKGRVAIHARNVSISTADISEHKFDAATGKLKKGKISPVGDVSILSKTINMETVETEQTDIGKFKETKLTDGSQINMRAEKVRIKTIDHEGKSVGKFSVTSQKISMKAVNIDNYKPDFDLDNQDNRIRPATMKSKELTPQSKMLLLAETMHIGYKKDKMRSKNVYMASEEKMVVGGKKETKLASEKTRLSMQDNTVQLLATGATEIHAGGGTTVKGKATFTGKVTGKDIEADNLTAKKAVKAPNIGDGMVMPAPPEQSPNVQEEKIPESDV